MPKLSLAKLERHLYSAADRLRQEGLDAATYKDYIFGMLFLKRCSDVWQAEHDALIARKVAQDATPAEAEAQYGENPDFYDSFFVPETAGWPYLQEKLNDATVSYGSVLDKALAALTEHNESLEHVLDHIQFMRVQSNKRIVSDDACKDLVRLFSRYRLRNEDFQFSDLLGSAYEFLINLFAESAGKKGGDFYTPRDVIRLMVRLLHPTPGMSIYTRHWLGGMLIISREYIEQSGGDPSNLRLAGQVNDASAWSICKLNMLLHGVPDADIRLEDTICTHNISKPESWSALIGSSQIRPSARTTPLPTWNTNTGSPGAGLQRLGRRVISCSPSTCSLSAVPGAWWPL